jgi:hypothetical protein
MAEPTRDSLLHYLRPGDEQLVRGADPLTAGMTLYLICAARAMAEALFPNLAQPERRDGWHDEPARQ